MTTSRTGSANRNDVNGHGAADDPESGTADTPVPTHHLHPANRRRHDNRDAGQRLADSVTSVFGSWRFIIIQTGIVIAWIADRQADTDRVKAEHDYRVNQLALQYLIVWHRDAHGVDCRCVEETAPIVAGLLGALARDL